MKTTPDDYDNLYRQIDFNDKPFGSNKDYIEWTRSKINKKIVSYLKPGKVLDVGGGYGFFKYALSMDQIYYNLEYSKEIQKYDNSDYKVIGTGLHLPFKDNTFENVVSGDVLEHVPDKRQYLEECFRVLKEDGTFVVNTPSEGTPSERFYGSFWFYIFCIGAIFQKYFKEERTFVKLEIPSGVIDEASDEKWLYSTLNDVGFTVIDGKRTSIHLPFGIDGNLWRKIVEGFIDEHYGNSILYACKKGSISGKSRDFESFRVIPIKHGLLRQKISNVSKKVDTIYFAK